MEFLIAMWSNLRGLFFAAAVVSALGALVFGIGWAIAHEFATQRWSDDADKARPPRFRLTLRRCLGSLAVFSLLACIPDFGDIWQARIALIKYQLASPENVQAASETIERIGRKLECKYLGGCEEPAGGSVERGR